ncbi:MAG: DNA polymerase I [Bacteroidaceae bacterium]|nr:DNA polymerase I [Bacteroidaceae bacterium]
MEKLFLLDAYALIYRAYYAFIKNPRINSKGMNTSAVMGFVNTLEEVINKEQPTHIGVAFDPSGPTFRHEAFPEYKAQREETPEAIRVAVPYIKKILAAYRIPILEVAGFEADDVIGTLSRQADERGIQTFMMTPDKDYAQLVTSHVSMYRPSLGMKEAEVLGPDEVKAKYGLEDPRQVIDMLGLMGDAADNIPGCPGVGEKTAQKLIQQFGSTESLLERSNELKGALKQKIEDNREQITFSKWLATIKTDVPITLDMPSLAVEEVDMEALKALYEELEFRALLTKKLQPAAAPPKAEKTVPKNAQLDLFGDALGAPNDPNDLKDSKDLKASQSTACQTYRDRSVTYTLVDTPEAMARLRDTLLGAEAICLDTETTSTESMKARLVGLSFGIKEDEAWYVPVPQDHEGAGRVVEVFRPVYESDILKIGQNLKYDLMVLQSYGIQLRGQMVDTMIAHYLISPELHHGMDYMAETLLNYQTIHIEELIGPKGKKQRSMADLTPEEVYVYACEDADVTLRLWHVLKPRLAELGCESLFYDIEMPLMPVLAYMERNGVCIDTEGLRETSRLFTEQMQQIEQEVHELTGVPDLNISSPKQVGEVLFDKLHITDKPKKTKTGQYVTSEEVLKSLRSKHPAVEKILAYRGLKKLLGTYIDALPTLINPQTGHIHTSFNQTVAATGRLSSSNPNLQNIPVRDAEGKEVRKAFIPEPGQEFFSADYSQIELRIMAHLSQDEHLIEAFRSGHDIHAATAAKIFHKEIGEVTSDERRRAKTANFGIIYGISAFGLAERLGCSRSEAKELIDGYFQSYPKVREYMDKSIAMARERGFTETLFHRRLVLPDINSHNSVVRGYAERNAINAPIQGTAADIIKIAMVRVYRRLIDEGYKSKMILQVHDELNFTVLPEEKERLERMVIEEMQAACELSVPLVADCGWGQNWLEAH